MVIFHYFYFGYKGTIYYGDREMLQMLKRVKVYVALNKQPWGMFSRYNYYICTVFFHGIRFKVKDKRIRLS